MTLPMLRAPLLTALALAILAGFAPQASANVLEKPSGKQARGPGLLRYRAFGERINLSGGAPARTDPSFQNRTYDAGLGIYDYRNRSFDPATGRFLQRDPVLGGDPLFNPYCFPGNNPVTNADPMGTWLVARNEKERDYIIKTVHAGSSYYVATAVESPTRKGWYIINIALLPPKDKDDKSHPSNWHFPKKLLYSCDEAEAHLYARLAADASSFYGISWAMGEYRWVNITQGEIGQAAVDAFSEKFLPALWNKASLGVKERVETNLRENPSDSVATNLKNATGSALAQASNVATLGVVDKVVDKVTLENQGAGQALYEGSGDALASALPVEEGFDLYYNARYMTWDRIAVTGLNATAKTAVVVAASKGVAGEFKSVTTPNASATLNIVKEAMARAESPSVVAVSRWGRPGLEQGDWVMKGGANRWNYFWSAKWQPEWMPGKNIPAPFKSGETFQVPSSTLSCPEEGFLPADLVKGAVGQRIYKKE